MQKNTSGSDSFVSKFFWTRDCNKRENNGYNNRDIQNASVSILDENEDSFEYHLQMKMASMRYGFKSQNMLK
jgi:hypothetical protein